MKIGVDASAAFREQKTGVGWYTYSLAQALASEMPNDTLYLCYISFITRRPQKFSKVWPNVRYRRISLFPGKLFNFLDHYLVAAPYDVLARLRADVFLFPNFFRLPLWLTRKSVVVIHDLGFLEAPEYLVPRHQRYMMRRVPQSAHQASHVVTVSEHARQQVIRHFGIAPGKVTVVSPGIDHGAFTPRDEAEVKAVMKRYKITKPYLLFLGTTDPRKNVEEICRAYTMLDDTLREKYQLVLAGAPGADWGWAWYDEKIDAIAKTLPADSILRTGYVDEADKPALLSGATIFVWPSIYEGWGMPIVEAMACGTPVITARNSSLPEAGGEAAAYVEDTSAQDIARLVAGLLRNDERRKQMRNAGITHAAKFTWQRSAGIMAGVLRQVGSSGRKRDAR